MLRYRAVFLLVIFLFVAHVSAQTPRAATDHFKNGNKKLESGDLTGAIEELSWAIEISSRLDVNRGTTHKALALSQSTHAWPRLTRIAAPYDESKVRPRRL